MERDRRNYEYESEYHRSSRRSSDRYDDRHDDRYSDRRSRSRYDDEYFDRRRPEEPERRRASQSQGQPPKKKKKKKKRSTLGSSMTYILMVFGISAILAVVGWTVANDLLALNKEEATASIYIAEDADFGDVVDQLKDKDIIISVNGTKIGTADWRKPSAHAAGGYIFSASKGKLCYFCSA